MSSLKSSQRKHLRGVAHSLKPVIYIGQKGLTPQVVRSAKKALETHELIKVKFIDFKKKEQKKEISHLFEKETGSQWVGLIGHVAIFYRRQKDPEKRRILLP